MHKLLGTSIPQAHEHIRICSMTDACACVLSAPLPKKEAKQSKKKKKKKKSKERLEEEQEQGETESGGAAATGIDKTARDIKALRERLAAASKSELVESLVTLASGDGAWYSCHRI